MPYPFAGPSHYDPSNDSTHPYRPKRPRSPSPPSPGFGTLASPLEDVLLKRRRRDDNYGYFSFDSPAGEAGSISEGGVHGQNGHGDEGGSGHAGPCRVDMAAGVERRRNRLWAARNAPSSQPESGSSTASDVHPNGAYGGYSEARQDQPPDAPYTAPRPSQRPRENSNSYGGDGIASSSRNGGHVMSSSPIRHEPPGSSPFKSSEPSTFQAIHHSSIPVSDSSGTIRASQRHRNGIISDREGTEIDDTQQGSGGGEGYGGQDFQQDDAMGDEVDMEELEKEWGEYRGANSLLYELHRARTTPQTTRNRPPDHASLHYTPHTPQYNGQPHVPQQHPPLGQYSYNDTITTPLQDQHDQSNYFTPITTPAIHRLATRRPLETPLRQHGTPSIPNINGGYVTPLASRLVDINTNIHTPIHPQAGNHQSRLAHHYQYRPTRPHYTSSPFAPPSFPSSNDAVYDPSSPLPTPNQHYPPVSGENVTMGEVVMEREEEEAMRRYEEMNRQLGEFAVARRERWGGD